MSAAYSMNVYIKNKKHPHKLSKVDETFVKLFHIYFEKHEMGIFMY